MNLHRIHGSYEEIVLYGYSPSPGPAVATMGDGLNSDEKAPSNS